MRRRISEAIVGVSVAIVLVLGLPLAVVARRSIRDGEVVKLQAAATRTLAEIAVPLDLGQLNAIRREPDAPPPFDVYDTDGRRIFGEGPGRADVLVRTALRGNPSTKTGQRIEVVVPITNRLDNEQVVGAVRVTASLRVINNRTRLAWITMAVSAAFALGLARLIGNRLARRLSRPITDLADAAERIGDGGALERRPPSGIEEIDSLTDALADSAERVNEALVRERRFSADVSHQLRTPITAIRLKIETARDDNDVAGLASALADLTRLEDTVSHLLAVARDSMPIVVTSRLDHAVRDAARRWEPRAELAGRTLTTRLDSASPSRGSPASIAQILDVLLDNAIRHGEGVIEISARRLPGGTAIDVQDEGRSIAITDMGRIFDRGHGDGHGIGLALARSIAEAEGGRLVLSRFQPTTFSLILVNHDPDLEADRQ